YQRVRWHVFGDDGTGGDKGPFAYRHTADYCGVCAYGGVSFYQCLYVIFACVSWVGTAWSPYVGKDHARAAKDVVFEDDALIYRDVILYLHVTSYLHVFCHVDVLPDRAVGAYLAVATYVADMPYLGALSDARSLVYVRRFVHKVIAHIFTPSLLLASSKILTTPTALSPSE